MRAFTAVGVALASPAIALSAGCGAGDDASVPAPVASDAGAIADGGPKADGGGEGGGDATTDAGAATVKHIFYIMMENHSYAAIFGPDAGGNAPYLNTLQINYGVATEYYGVTHPSLPNYLAAISGDSQEIFDDCAAGPSVTCQPERFFPNPGSSNLQQLTPGQAANAAVTPHWFSGKNLVDELEDKGLTWIAYMESIAGAGDTSEFWPYDLPDGGPEAGAPIPRELYAQNHNPFMYFEDIRSNSARMQKIVPFDPTKFAADLSAANVPNFVWISPNQCNDMHSLSAANAAAVGIPTCAVVPVGDAGATDDSTVIGLGDTFVRSTVQTIMASPAWKDPSIILIVWNEGDDADVAGCCKGPTGMGGGFLGGGNALAIVVSSEGAKPVTSATPYNHYSLLATIQKVWGLPCLANTCGMSGWDLMTPLFMP